MMAEMNPKLLPDLLVFLEVARSGSISKAAHKLYTVQTNVSARMQKLESALGSRLLVRTTRGISLTSAGESLLPVARRLGSLIGEVDQIFPKSHRPALLRIGSLETFAAAHLATLIANYQAIDPRADTTIISGSSRSLLRMLQDNELDIAFVSYPASGETVRTEFAIREELVLLVPTNRVYSLKPEIQDGNLPLIVQRHACSYSERFLSFAAKRNLRIPKMIEAGSIEAVLGLVQQGVGIAVAPRSLIKGSARKIRTASLRQLGTQRWVSIYLVSNQSINQSMVRFVEHCREHFAVEQGARPGGQSGD
jgi:LysR family transcriptional regulator, cell division regulator